MFEKQASHQGNKHKASKPPTANHHKGDKVKVVAVNEKVKSDSNGSKIAVASASGSVIAPADAAPKPKPKKFGEDYVEAPLPTVNPWKKPAATVSVSASFGPDLQPNQTAVVTQRKDPYRAAVAPSFVSGMSVCY